MRTQSKVLQTYIEKHGTGTFVQLLDFFLLHHLNQNPEAEDAKRVAVLIDLLREAEKLDERLYQANREPADIDRHTEQEYKQIVKQLNRLLGGYEWRPGFTSSEYVPGWGSFYGIGPGVTGVTADWENKAILFLPELVKSRLMHRFRRCRECNKWLFAVREHQHYCNESCRKKFAGKSDIFKEKRRRYMARYRREQKARSVAALARARKASNS